jgi:1,2-diacylglycerol 3-beta-glucosyltransferase
MFPEKFIAIERLLLAALIVVVWTIMAILEVWVPQVSFAIAMIAIMLGYSTLVSISMIHQKRKARKNPAPVEDLSSFIPHVSIFLPAHNEELVIANTVANLMNLEYPSYDVLVIDDRSRDATPHILKDLKAKYGEKFEYMIRPMDAIPGKSAVLNDALSVSLGEVVAVFDADARVEPDFLSRMVPFLYREGVGAVQARKVILNASHNLLTQCQNYEYAMDAYFQCGRDAIRGAVELRGNGLLVKRTALESVNGWNNRTLTDDLDLSTRLHLAGWDIRFAHKVTVGEEGITQFCPLLRQRRRWAEGSLIRYLDYSGSILTCEGVSFRTIADMVAYFVQFLLPLWVVSDYALLLITYLMDGEAVKSHVITSLIVLPLLSLYFSINLVIAILRFNRPHATLLDALGGAFWTGLYMVAVWFPTVFAIIVKVLFQKERSMNWRKTAHFGMPQQTQAESH